jgi:hypothetical protein
VVASWEKVSFHSRSAGTAIVNSSAMLPVAIVQSACRRESLRKSLILQVVTKMIACVY